MSSPQRYSNGVTNRASSDQMGQLILPDPTIVHTFFDDFNRYAAADWVITTTEDGSSSATEAIQDEDGGVLKLTNDNKDNDCDYLQLSGDGGSTANEIFALESGKKAWFKCRIAVSDATQSDWLIGLTDIDTTPLDASDGIWFQKDDGDTNIDFHVAASSSTSSASAAGTNADATYVELAWYYDGKNTIEYWIDNNLEGTLTADTLPTTELTVTFGIVNGATAAKTMSIDYIYAAKER